MTVAQLTSTMSASEFGEWAAYLKLKADEQDRAQKEAQSNSRRR